MKRAGARCAGRKAGDEACRALAIPTTSGFYLNRKISSAGNFCSFFYSREMASETVFNAAVGLCGMQRTPPTDPKVLVSEPYAPLDHLLRFPPSKIGRVPATVDRKALKVAGRSGAAIFRGQVESFCDRFGGFCKRRENAANPRRRAGVRVRSDAETAGLRTRSLSAAFAAGCDAFDAKPIQFERLLATLRRLGRAAGDSAERS
jgi:hypothetical protein